MAAEYLKRTPTSTGNRRVFTFALWIKRSSTSQDYLFQQRADSNSSQQYNLQIQSDSQIRALDQNSGTSELINDSSRLIRDFSGWYHLMVAADTTLGDANDRHKMYMNGDLVTNFDTPTNYDLNYSTSVSTLVRSLIGAQRPNSSATLTTATDLQLFDYFYVDGQALTPDVFGFYKDGDGYMSSGTSQATDFRPGQWMPHSPAKIKKDINRRGGFGVNGFYLPMNDSSNPGADFHCAPNSIIKLKGEDLPQPRNGAPTTSDAYVSQLRSDPYAANLILAVPGIALENTNTELVTNGTFNTNTTGWTFGTNSTSSVVNGELRARSSSGDLHNQSYQNVTTVVGTRYTVSATVRIESGGQPAWLWIDGTSVVNSSSTSNTTISYDFTATSTTTKVGITERVNSYTYYDNISLIQALQPRDYSADIKGSGSNKTLTANGTAGVGYDLGGYYGSAMTFDGADATNFNLGNDSDFDFGTGDFTIEFWRNRDSVSDTESYFTKYDNGATQSFWFGPLDTGRESFYWYDTDGTHNIISNNNIAVAGQFDHICAERHTGTVSLYVNGVSVGISTLGALALNTTTHNVKIGANDHTSGTTYYPFDGVIQDLRVYKGVAKYKGGFDVPKPYTPVGIEAFRTTTDTCKNNFVTMNSLNKNGCTLSNGNLTTADSTSNGGQIYSTMGSNTGKWYYEAHVTDVGASAGTLIGINPLIRPSTNQQNRTAYRSSGDVYSDSSTVQTGTTYTTGDIIGVAWDADNKKLWFAKNGSWVYSGNPAGGTNPAVTYTNTETQGPSIQYDNGGQSQVTNLNFGQNPTFSGQVTAGTNADGNGKGLFKYAPPTGFLALCEDNLPTPAIADPGDHFKCVLYEGDGNSGRSITGVGFQPDLVWIKERSSTSSHAVFDSVRGAGLRLMTDTTATESVAENVYNPSFNNDGFTVGTDGAVNQDGQTYVAWCWKAGGAAVSNSDGDLTSQVSVNQDAGFSIATYTTLNAAATFGHGLGKKPAFALFKARNNSGNWAVYHQSLGTNTIRLSTSGAEDTSADAFNSTSPTDTLMYLGTWAGTNGSNVNWVSYLWAEIEGYSKFGSYTGNNSADGPFAYCGFKPAWVLIKKTNGSGDENWRLFDSSRCPTNQNNKHLLPSTNSAESTETGMDFLSNGFKLRHADAHQNQNGTTYIFAAFAESPFQTANAK